MRVIATMLLVFSCVFAKAQDAGNQGEEEDLFAKQLFQEKYKDTAYSEQDQKNLLGWIGIDSLTNPGLKELVFLREGATRRRFKFWQFRVGVSNPVVWYVELTNAKATTETEPAVFLEEAVLTFYVQGAVVL